MVATNMTVIIMVSVKLEPVKVLFIFYAAI